jgi:hypothetical protein
MVLSGDSCLCCPVLHRHRMSEAHSWELGMRQYEMARRCNKDASGKRASVSLGINLGRLRPSQGPRRTSWWNSSCPPGKIRTKRKSAGRVPVSERVVCHNGVYSKYFVLLPPSLSQAVTSPYDCLHPQHELRQCSKSRASHLSPNRRKKSQQWQDPDTGPPLAAPPRHARCAHPMWPLPGTSLLQRRHSPTIRPSLLPRRANPSMPTTTGALSSRIFLRPLEVLVQNLHLPMALSLLLYTRTSPFFRSVASGDILQSVGPIVQVGGTDPALMLVASTHVPCEKNIRKYPLSACTQNSSIYFVGFTAVP